MASGAEEMREATDPSREGIGKLNSPWAGGDPCSPVIVPELVTVGSGGLPPAVPELAALLLLLLEEPPLAVMPRDDPRSAEPSDELPQWDSNPGRPGGVRSRPCSRRRRTLQVAAVSETTERSSESFPWSFFCLVRRFWNHTFTCRGNDIRI